MEQCVYEYKLFNVSKGFETGTSEHIVVGTCRYEFYKAKKCYERVKYLIYTIGKKFRALFDLSYRSVFVLIPYSFPYTYIHLNTQLYDILSLKINSNYSVET